MGGRAHKVSFLELEFHSKLKFVRISFSTSTYDRIKKVERINENNFPLYHLQDRAAKFVDQLSAIGGTMGLLTGFSLISAVEIIYFTVKIIWKMIQPKV